MYSRSIDPTSVRVLCDANLVDRVADCLAEVPFSSFR